MIAIDHILLHDGSGVELLSAINVCSSTCHAVWGVIGKGIRQIISMLNTFVWAVCLAVLIYCTTVSTHPQSAILVYQYWLSTKESQSFLTFQCRAR